MEDRVIFTKEMKEEYTILIPQMAPFHFDLLSSTLNSYGYKSVVLRNTGSHIGLEGNRYVHNDTCVPAIYVIGQIMDALKSGEYDINKVAIIMTQTGGGCRASNYIHLIRQALKKAKLEFIPVISLNASNIESNPGFKIDIPILRKIIQSLVLGDLIMQVHHETLPYEVNKGETNKLSDYWLDYLSREYLERKNITNIRLRTYIKKIIKDFESIPITNEVKPKIGIVGEIYVKYSPLGNNNLEDFLLNEGCEVVTPGIIDFLLYTFESVCYDQKQYGGTKKTYYAFKMLSLYVERPRLYIRKELAKSRYHVPMLFKDLKKLALPFISHGTHVGEGWLLTAEIIELIKMDVKNVITTQPFGCLPNHIVARGMFKSIKKAHPEANFASIDFDVSASVINQENRIKLLILNAKDKLNKK